MNRRILFLVIGLAASLIRAAAGDFIQGQAIVIKVTGNGAMLDAVSQVQVPLTAGSLVTANQVVKTEKGAVVILALTNGTLMRVGENSTVVLAELNVLQPGVGYDYATATDEPTASKTKVKVSSGDVILKVKKLKFDQGSQFSVETPVGTAGVRGTTYRVALSGVGTAAVSYKVSLLEGVVNFKASTNSLASQNLQAGKMFFLQALRANTTTGRFENWPAQLAQIDIPAAELAEFTSHVSELIAASEGLRFAINTNASGQQEMVFEAAPATPGLGFLRHPAPPVVPPLPSVSPTGGE